MIARANGTSRMRFSRIVDRHGRPFRFGYDATEPKKRRRPATGLLRSEDAELPAAKRRDLVSGMRDIQRNYALAAWAIRKHPDFVSTFTPPQKNAPSRSPFIPPPSSFIPSPAPSPPKENPSV